MSRKRGNKFGDLRDVPAQATGNMSTRDLLGGLGTILRSVAVSDMMAAMKVAEANHRPTYPKPVELLVPGDVIVTRDERNHETRTPVRIIDRHTCRNHVHLNDRACYDRGYPVEVLRV